VAPPRDARWGPARGSPPPYFLLVPRANWRFRHLTSPLPPRANPPRTRSAAALARGRAAGLRFKKAHVVHPELQATFQLDILGVKKNPSSALYTNLGVITRGTVIEVNVSELGLVTTTGKVVWGKYAQVTNNPELDGCINAVLLV
jgi:ribosomal protein S8E